MSKWGWIVVGGGVLFASLLTLWQSEQPRRVQAKNVFATKKIVVGTTGDYKPFTYLNRKTNEYEGFDIEVIRSFAKTTGIDVEFVPTTISNFPLARSADSVGHVVGTNSTSIPVVFAKERITSISNPSYSFVFRFKYVNGL